MAWSVVCLLASTPAQCSHLVHAAVALECNIYYLIHSVNITLLISFNVLWCIQMDWIVFCLQFTVHYTVYSIMTKTNVPNVYTIEWNTEISLLNCYNFGSWLTFFSFVCLFWTVTNTSITWHITTYYWQSNSTLCRHDTFEKHLKYTHNFILKYTFSMENIDDAWLVILHSKMLRYKL